MGVYEGYRRRWVSIARFFRTSTTSGLARAERTATFSGPKERRDQVPVLTVEDEQRMIHMLAVVAMVVGVFLLSVSGIRGRVEVQ
jgi:hypothetical protein